MAELDVLLDHSDGDHHETYASYEPSSEYLVLARARLDETWILRRTGPWYGVAPRNQVIPKSGWKIHISANPYQNAQAILTTVIRILAERPSPFKFSVDPRTLAFMNGKNYPREHSGKFITIYPPTEEAFVTLLNCLYSELRGFQGSRILSDRMYKDCAVLHYRYGAFTRDTIPDSRGMIVSAVMVGGTPIIDRRAPYFILPPGVTDPVQSELAPIDARCLRNYDIAGALGYSNSGGVYLAIDRTTSQRVVIKEARPFTSISGAWSDARDILKKEHRILSLLRSSQIAPAPRDFFEEAGHSFLVQDFINGPPLSVVATTRAIHSDGSLTATRRQSFYDGMRSLFINIAGAFATLHSKGIVFGDISPRNIIVGPDADRAWLVDFEGAQESGVDPMVPLRTLAFASKDRRRNSTLTPAEDRFGFGLLLFSYLVPIAAALHLDSHLLRRFLSSLERNLSLPSDIAMLILRLTCDNPESRPEWQEIAGILTGSSTGRVLPSGPSPSPRRDLMDGALSYIRATATLTRDDRLFPADPSVFSTNPVSVAFGAAGVLYASHTISGEVETAWLEWLLRRMRRWPGPFGLYLGSAGIAWVLLELGITAEAVALLSDPDAEIHALERSDWFYGAAGWGAAQLRAYSATGDERFLEAAERAGRRLIALSVRDRSACYWSDGEYVSCSLGHGVAGVCLFLTYLSAVTRNAEYLDSAGAGIRFIMSRVCAGRSDGILWRAREEDDDSRTPYWRWGAAGIGAVLLRYGKLASKNDATGMATMIVPEVSQMYGPGPGRFSGLAGFGEFLLDAASFGAVEDGVVRAKKVADGIQLFAISRPAGIAYPSERLTRLSCDFGTGSAGIAVFQKRLESGMGASLMLDFLLA